jgi:hypothetical protein
LPPVPHFHEEQHGACGPQASPGQLQHTPVLEQCMLQHSSPCPAAEHAPPEGRHGPHKDWS